MKKLKAIDYFCSGGGMSYGLHLSGIDIIAGIDMDISCKDTYEKNIPSSSFIHKDISKLSEIELEQLTGIDKDDDEMVFAGCSPCQFWTILNTNKTKSKKSKRG